MNIAEECNLKIVGLHYNLAQSVGKSVNKPFIQD